MNNVDCVIQNILAKDLQLPKSYTEMINDTLETLPEKKKNIPTRKIQFAFATMCCCTCLTIGIVLAKDYVENFFNFNKGMDTAIENGYIEEPKTKYIEVNGTEVTIENYLMDDFNFSFTASIKLPDNIDVTKIARGRLVNFIITDEESRVLYCDNKETFDSYKKEKGLTFEFPEHNENNINNGTNWYIKEKNSKTNTLKLIYNLNTPGKYPKSKKLNFNFTNINLSEREIYENEETVLQGEWNIDIDVPEKFYNRECIVYAVESCSNPELSVIEAEVYETCMKFKFELPFKKIYNQGDNEEKINKKVAENFEKRQKIEEELKSKYMHRDYEAEAKSRELLEKRAEEYSVESKAEGYITINEVPIIMGYNSEEAYKAYKEEHHKSLELFDEDFYVQTSDGKRYYPSQDGSGENLFDEDFVKSTITYSRMFTLTKYDVTDEIEVHINYNPNYSGNWEEIVVKLKRIK